MDGHILHSVYIHLGTIRLTAAIQPATLLVCKLFGPLRFQGIEKPPRCLPKRCLRARRYDFPYTPQEPCGGTIGMAAFLKYLVTIRKKICLNHISVPLYT